MDYHISGDTLTIDYSVKALGFVPDSMVIEVSPDIFFLGENAKDRANNACIFGCYTGDSITVDENGVTGSISFLHGGHRRTFWNCHIIAYYTDTSGQAQYFSRFISLSSDQYEMGMEIFIPSGGVYQSLDDSPISKEGLLIGWGMSAGYSTDDFRLALSTSWSGIGKNFTFSEPFRVGVSYNLPSIGGAKLQLTGGVKVGKVKLKSGDREYYRKGWGADYGFGIEGPFERLNYSYSLTPERYHTVELFLMSGATRRSRFGTRFVVQRSERLWMFRLGLHIEGAMLPMEANRNLLRKHNPRPLPHKILSWAGVAPTVIIFGPFYLGAQLVELVKKKVSSSE